MCRFFCTCARILGVLYVVFYFIVDVVAVVLQVAVNIFILCLVDGPVRVFAPYQSLPKVLYFLLEKLWPGTNCFCPIVEYTYDTILYIYIYLT